MPTLSVVFSVNDEEDVIEDALQSVTWADEIIVVDGGSSDKTVEIAKKYANQVHVFPGESHIHTNKNRAIDYAASDWILLLDADERVTTALKQEIQEQCLNADFDGYYIPRKNYAFGKWLKHGGNYPDYALRLFRKGKGRYPVEVVHEQISVEGSIGYTKQPMDHVCISRALEITVKKLNLYSTIEAQFLFNQKVEVRMGLLIGKPLLHFFRVYFFKVGFLDGIPGLISALISAFSVFMRYAKLYQRENI